MEHINRTETNHIYTLGAPSCEETATSYHDTCSIGWGYAIKHWGVRGATWMTSSCGSDPTSRFEAHALLATDSYQTSPKSSTKKKQKPEDFPPSTPQPVQFTSLPGRFEVSDHSNHSKHPPPGARHRNLQSPDGGHMQIRNHCFVHRSDRLGFLRHWLKRKPWKPWDPWDYDVDFLSDPP